MKTGEEVARGLIVNRDRLQLHGLASRLPEHWTCLREEYPVTIEYRHGGLHALVSEYMGGGTSWILQHEPTLVPINHGHKPTFIQAVAAAWDAIQAARTPPKPAAEKRELERVEKELGDGVLGHPWERVLPYPWDEANHQLYRVQVPGAGKAVLTIPRQVGESIGVSLQLGDSPHISNGKARTPAHAALLVRDALESYCRQAAQDPRNPLTQGLCQQLLRQAGKPPADVQAIQDYARSNKSQRRALEASQRAPISEGQSIVESLTGRGYTCPRCNRTSYHPKDLQERYCSACQAFEDEAKDAPHREAFKRAGLDPSKPSLPARLCDFSTGCQARDHEASCRSLVEEKKLPVTTRELVSNQEMQATIASLRKDLEKATKEREAYRQGNLSQAEQVKALETRITILQDHLGTCRKELGEQAWKSIFPGTYK